MIFRSVLIFLICWQCIGGEDIENISIESVLDQIAIPTKIISDFLQKPIKATATQKDSPRTDTPTVHYENSNGFIPLVVSTPSQQPKEKENYPLVQAESVLNETSSSFNQSNKDSDKEKFQSINNLVNENNSFKSASNIINENNLFKYTKNIVEENNSTKPETKNARARNFIRRANRRTNGPKKVATDTNLSSLESNPVFNPAARFFFNLPNSKLNRRSFSVEDAIEEFELLKLSNNDTSSVANFNSYYEHTSKPERSYYEHSSRPERTYYEQTSKPERSYYEHTSKPERPYYEQTSKSERSHYEHTSKPERPYYEQTSRTERSHYEPTSKPERSYQEQSSKPERPYYEQTTKSERSHHEPTSKPERSYQEHTSRPERTYYERVSKPERTFYEQTSKPEQTHQEHTSKPGRSSYGMNYKKAIRNKDRGRGKQIQSYLASYDATNEENKYKHSTTTEEPVTKKEVSQQENYPNHQRQENTGNYRGQKTYQKPTYASVSTPKSDTDYYATSTAKSEEPQKFIKPIVVHPSEYKVDVRFSGQTVQTVVSSTNKPQSENKNPVITESEPKIDPSTEQFTPVEGNSRTYETADSRNFSEENPEYVDEADRPRRMQKTTKRRQNYFDSSKKLPKEHREVYDEYDDQGRKIRPASKYKSSTRNRPKQRPIQIIPEEDQYDTNNEGENMDYNTNDSTNQQNTNDGNTWNQVGPNVEVSHSSGFELNQIEKPKLHIVPVNILSQFDHATALDNSQGFDISNAMFTGFQVQDGSLVSSTASPLVSSTSSYIDHSYGPSSTIKPKMEVASSIPDVIVGQNSFNNPVQAVLMPHKLQQHMLNQYAQASTASPTVFAVTPTPNYASSSTIAPQVQQLLSQAFSQPLTSGQSLSNYASSPLPSSGESDQIYINPNGLQGQNNYQHTQSTTSRSTTERSSTTRKKKYNSNSSGQYLASASLSVSHERGRKKHNRYGDKENKYNSNDYDNNDNHNYNSQSNQQSTRQALNTIVQPTMIPAILHTGIGIIGTQNQQLVANPLLIAAQQNPQLLKATNEALVNTMKQLQYGIQNNRNQWSAGVDSVGGASSNVNNLYKAQLPMMGPKNVEIINPNLNPNSYALNQIPATLVTTPIPIFTTTGFITPKSLVSSTTPEPSVSIQSIVNTLTEIGTKKSTDYGDSNINSYLNRQGPDRSLFNPINFVPNYDLVKSQSVLNTNVVPNEQFSQNLNLVPIVPGGNFFKHSQGAQYDLENKPKLNSDLEKYAAEMFKESLRTIYNSHKWNNDPRYPLNVSLVDNSEIAKLRNELLRIKNNLRDKMPKDMIEGHHSETKLRKTKPGSEYKRPDSSHERPHKHKHHNKMHLVTSASHKTHHRLKPEINDYLTPPKVHTFISGSPFHADKPPKKRPSHGSRTKLKSDSRPRPRQGIVVTHKPKSVEPQASALYDYRLPIQLAKKEKIRYSQPDYYAHNYNNYPTFTTMSPDNDPFKSSMEFKSSEKDYYHDFNNQRTHNLMGLLMKNKQLPQGSFTSTMTNNNYLHERSSSPSPLYFNDENKKAQIRQTSEGVLQSFQQRSDKIVRPVYLANIPEKDSTQKQQ